MGVPRLFKHLTERYPSLCQTVVANQLLSYDYLYIDLNNLIHKALSEKCLLPLEKVDDDFWTEARIFERVLRYIETLHRIIPSKVLFLSIDGVAPRAKWSTQRGRRVQAAGRNEPIPFDKNAISPGTTFMANFESALLDFISSKNTFHHCWQNCEVFISGSNVPGEGSIKIINFIGSLKQKKNYKSDATHCIYSCDNDYLMLGLTTQELYISLLQERKNCPSTLAALCFTDIKHQFIVIHFEMLRQYLRMEFIECEEYMKFAFNMDSIVNDWVVLMTLFGNDYLPGLPTFVLDHDVLTIIYDAYKSTMKSSNGYINEQGLLNVRRFARLLQELKDRNFELYRKKITKSIETVTNKLSAVNLGTEIDAKSELTVNDFLDMKDQFYAEHLGNSNLPDFENMSIDYVKTIQWVLFYYHDRKFSWTHQYPYKCAPFAGDFVGVHRMTFSMDFDKPVNVFTHLLAILPKSSANLLPKPYHQYMSEEMDEMEDLCQKSTLAEKHLTIDEKERNALKTMLRIRYVQSEDDKNKVEISTISNNKNKNSPQRSIDRPIDRNNFNFMFSTLTLHDFSCKIIQSLLKPYPRMVITLHDDKLPNIETVAKEYLNEIVYVGWPHSFEAKVMQVFDANKKIHASSVDIDLTQSSDEFNACNDNLMSRFGERGIDVGKIQFIGYVAPLKWMEYEATENNSNSYRLTKRWADKWEPVAVQTMIKSCIAIKVPTVKHVADVLCIPNAFLFGGNSNCYGEIATIAATDEVEKTGRVNIMCYLDQDPNFDKAKETYTASKMNQLNQYKTANTAATLLGISSKTFARITGAVLVNAVNSVENSPKINIGLRLKSRSLFHINVRVLDGYVKSRGKEFIYSQLAIDLVQEYLNKFPRVFELISMSDAKVLLVSDFDQNNNQNGLEYVGEIRKWIGSLPHSKMTHKISDSLKLNDDAIRNVQEAVCAMYEVEPKLIKLKMKWQNLYIPDMNNVFAIPCPNASYKLLDRVMVVRSGYPVPVGSKGPVIGIDPMHYHTIGDDITESDLYGLDILMDSSFTIQSKACPFQRHNVFRIHSTNMIINISHGRSK